MTLMKIPKQIEAVRDSLPEIAAEVFGEAGAHTLESAPVRPEAATATVEISVSPTFRAPGDARDLGAVVTSIGFVP